jgi:crotonobetainyl-CoA:carnitine CoA-transferase CaiB-like acyl-CoA transferase
VEEALAGAGVPCSAVAEIEDVLASPQLRAREMFVELTGTYAGAATLTGIPVKLDATPGSIRRPPPRAGADTDRILAEVVGLQPREIDELRASGAI